MSQSLYVHEYQSGDIGGPTLVLLHGFPVDHRMFDSMVMHLDPRVRVLGVDLPGLGQSRKVLPEPPSLEASARLVMQSIEVPATSPLVIAGLSMGGYVAQAIAQEFADDLAGLILLDTRTNADGPAARENRLKVAGQAQEQGTSEAVAPMALTTLSSATQQGRPKIVEFMERLVAEQTGAGVAWSQRAMAQRPDRSKVVAGLDLEILLIVGEADEISPPDVMGETARAAQHGLLEVVSDAGHMTPVEQPLPVARLINIYLNRVVPTPAS